MLSVEGSVVRLDLDDLSTLLDAGGPSPQDGEPAPGTREALAVAGVPEALEAVRPPLVQLAVDVAGRAGVRSHRAWVDRTAAAFVLAVDEDRHQLLATTPDLVAAGLARVLRLRPHRVTDARVATDLDPELLADLFHDDELRRVSAFVTLGVDLAWNLGALTAEGEAWWRAVSGPTGLWWVETSPDGLRSVPTTATEVWRRLSVALRVAAPNEPDAPDAPTRHA